VQELVLKRADWRPEYARQRAPDTLPIEPVNDDLIVREETGRILLAQVRIDDGDDLQTLTRILRFRLRWDDGNSSTKSQGRLSGIRYRSRVFGFTEPKPLRKRFAASAAKLHEESPEAGAIIVQRTACLHDLLTEVAPEEARLHDELVTGVVHPDWLLDGKPWTSGIINCTAALPYHTDSGNIKGSWSAMLALRRDVDGGWLHLPEYGLALGIPDRSVTLFDGARTWHGVTGFKMRRADAYRFTLVWYAKQGFAKVGAAADEVARGARHATEVLHAE